MDKGIVILTSHKYLNHFFVRELAKHVTVKAVVYESQGLSKQFKLVLRRCKKLGVFKTMSQVLFALFHRFYLAPASKKKVEQLIGKDVLPEVLSFEVENVNSKEVFDTIRKANPFAIVVSGTGILRRELLSLPIPFINIHTGITPMYRGVYGGFWALYNKDFENIGVTVHMVDEGVDTGQILYQERIKLDPSFDTFDTIAAKQYSKGAELMVKALEDITSGTLRPFKREGESQQWYHPTIGEYVRGMKVLKQ